MGTNHQEGGGKTLGLYAKTFVALLATALVPLLAVGGYNYFVVQEQTTARVNRQFEDVAKVIDANVSGWIETNLRALQENARLPDMRSMSQSRQVPILRAIADTYDWAFLACTIGSDGKNVARSDSTPLADYSDRAYIRQAMTDKILTHSVVLSKTTGSPALALAYPLAADSGPGGVLMFASALRDLSESITTTKIGRTGSAFLLDTKGQVIAHPIPDIEGAGKLRDFSKHPAFQAMVGQKFARGEFSENGKDFLFYARTTALGWTIVVQQEARETFAPVREAAANGLTIVIAAVLFVLVAAWLLSRGLAAPIVRLTKIADAVSRGEAGTEIVDARRTDEIGALASAIDRLRISVQVSLTDRARKPGANPAIRAISGAAKTT
jgi:methyl-accepting chemotaxis protein